jgi:hypothetical protein
LRVEGLGSGFRVQGVWPPVDSFRVQAQRNCCMLWSSVSFTVWWTTDLSSKVTMPSRNQPQGPIWNTFGHVTPRILGDRNLRSPPNGQGWPAHTQKHKHKLSLSRTHILSPSHTHRNKDTNSLSHTHTHSLSIPSESSGARCRSCAAPG